MIRFDRSGVVLCCAALFVLSVTARSQNGAQTPLAAPSIPPDIIGNAAFERLLDEESENEEGLSELLERFDGWLRRPVPASSREAPRRRPSCLSCPSFP